jgi:hypothetical protein
MVFPEGPWRGARGRDEGVTAIVAAFVSESFITFMIVFWGGSALGGSPAPAARPRVKEILTAVALRPSAEVVVSWVP